MTTPVPRLPSPVFLLLAPSGTGQGKLTPQLLAQIDQAVSSGSWTVDPNEVDPRSGLTLFQAMASSNASTMEEKVRIQALRLAVAWGADVNAPSPKGRAPWENAIRNQEWELARALERLGVKPSPGWAPARQQEVAAGLRDPGRFWGTGERVIDSILEPGSFGDLDARLNGVPLGLLPAWSRLGVTRASIPPHPGASQANVSDTDKWMELLGDYGKAALKRAPSCDFALWVWMCQAQVILSSDDSASRTRQEKWRQQWASLERAITRARYRGQDPAQSAQSLSDDAIALVATTLGEVHAAGQASPDRLQGLAAFGMAALARWANPSHGVESRPLHERAPAPWKAAAAFCKALPEALWQEVEFAKAWSSAARYALGGSLGLALQQDQDIPPAPAQAGPWLTLVHLVRPNMPSGEHDTLVRWLLEHPAPPEDVHRGLAMLSFRPRMQARLRQFVLEASLEPAGPASSRPRVRV